MSENREPENNGNPWMKSLMVWGGIFLALLLVVSMFSGPKEPAGTQLRYSDFRERVAEGSVEEVQIAPDRITGTLRNNETFSTIPVPNDIELTQLLEEKGVRYAGTAPEEPNVLLYILIQSLPFLLILGIAFFALRQVQKGGGSGAMGFGKSKAKLLTEKQGRVTFDDVAGIDEAREELQEIVEFLRDPQRFSKLGGQIPKGALLVGSPGTGKTLLARAIAGEARVPFFTISGSDFVEMFVGVGASRVRDMFEQAKKHAPCIIFIDEIDAVGRHRGAGMGGGHDEREQTLNQLLVEMDGFEMNDGIIVIAATNRPDVLDPALLRPGRFDRQVVVGLPDIRGREQILKVHMRKVPLGDSVEPALIARGTPGFSGADLANLVNEASLFAARAGKRIVEMKEFELAKDKIMMGAERKSMVMSEKEKLNTAYHEAGHAIVGRVVPEHDPVYKVSIIPRGRALGVTMFLPEEDRYSLSKRALISQICSLFGGRIAEEMTLGFEGVTTGASNDIQRATQLARNMVTKWGLSEKLGPLMYAEEEGEVFLGRSAGSQHANVSGETARMIDEEVRSIIDQCYGTAKQILADNRDKLDVMAEALMKYETIDAAQIDDIMAGRIPREPRDWEGGSGAPGAPVQPEGERPDTPIGGPAAEH